MKPTCFRMIPSLPGLIPAVGTKGRLRTAKLMKIDGEAQGKLVEVQRRIKVPERVRSQSGCVRQVTELMNPAI